MKGSRPRTGVPMVRSKDNPWSQRNDLFFLNKHSCLLYWFSLHCSLKGRCHKILEALFRNGWIYLVRERKRNLCCFVFKIFCSSSVITYIESTHLTWFTQYLSHLFCCLDISFKSLFKFLRVYMDRVDNKWSSTGSLSISLWGTINVPNIKTKQRYSC